VPEQAQGVARIEAAPALEPYVVPIAALVLLGLFLLQRGGTARVGALFGPVMLAWFTTLGLLGLAQIVQNPAVLVAPGTTGSHR
jgi:KUP system potassium uptake protein